MRMILKFIPRRFHWHIGYAVGWLQSFKKKLKGENNENGNG